MSHYKTRKEISDGAMQTFGPIVTAIPDGAIREAFRDALARFGATVLACPPFDPNWDELLDAPLSDPYTQEAVTAATDALKVQSAPFCRLAENAIGCLSLEVKVLERQLDLARATR